MSDFSQILLDDFNFYRTHTNHFQRLRQLHPGIKLSKLNKQREALLTEMVAWCRSQNIDPRHWLFCLFARSRWLFSPKWTAGFLLSKNALKWYREKSGKVNLRLYKERLYQTRDVQQVQEGRSPDYNSLVDLSAEVEARKARLLARHDEGECLDAISGATHPTLGYHPLSKVCQRCPAAEECRRKTALIHPFDVVALRSGMMTLEQANLAASVHGRS